MSDVTFLYGPQTSGKTTQLLRMVQKDHGNDVLMSGEDQDRISNGREECRVTLHVPKFWTDENRFRFRRRLQTQLPVRHVLVDGAQFLSKAQLRTLIKIVRGLDIPLVLAGCRYYVSSPRAHDSGEIPVSRWLLKRCGRDVPVDRNCDFCSRIATRLYVSGFKRLTSRKIVAVDPHLVCNVHYQRLIHQN